MIDEQEVATIRVNGRRHSAEAGLTIERLLARLDITARYALVERNGAPVTHDRFDSVELEAGDELVIARPVAGG